METIFKLFNELEILVREGKHPNKQVQLIISIRILLNNLNKKNE